MKKQKEKFDLFAMPFSVDVNSAPHELQMKIIELQSSDMLQAKFDSVPIANFYKEYVPKSTYPHLHDNAKRVMCFNMCLITNGHTSHYCDMYCVYRRKVLLPARYRIYI